MEQLKAGTSLKDTILLWMTNIPANKKTAYYNRISEHYKINDATDLDNIHQRISDAISDLTFVQGVQHNADALAARGITVRQYLFDHDTKGSGMVATLLNMETKGTCHADEIFYQFDCMFKPDEFKGADVQVSQNFIDIWTSFATFGNPLPGATWDATRKERPVYLVIGPELKQTSGVFHDENIKFLNSIDIESLEVDPTMNRSEL